MPACILETCAHFKQREREVFTAVSNEWFSIAVNWTYGTKVWVVWKFAKNISLRSSSDQDAESFWGFWSSPHKAFVIAVGYFLLYTDTACTEQNI